MTTSFTSRLGTAPEEGVKAPCVVSTTANITLSGEQTINTVSVTAGDRVLVRSQTDNTENGIYVCSTGAWSRSTDFNDAQDVLSGILVADSYTGVLYKTSFSGTYSPGTTAMTFAASLTLTGAEIKSLYEAEADTNAFTDAEQTKLSGIETGADVTDAANVDAAGAVMNSDTSTATMSFVVDEDNMASNLATKVPTQQSVKAYVDGLVASQLTYQGGYDASTNTPDLDTSPSGIGIGYMYTVTVAGTFFTVAVEVGDVLISEQNNPTLESHWTIVNKNLVDVVTQSGTQTITGDKDFTGALTKDSNVVLTEGYTIGDQGCRTVRTADQTLATGVTTPVEFDSDSFAGAFDPLGMHDHVSDKTKIYIPAGWTKVEVVAAVYFKANGTGSRTIEVKLNTTTKAWNTVAPYSAGATIPVQVATGVLEVVGGTDYILINASQDSGGNLDLFGASLPFVSVRRVA